MLVWGWSITLLIGPVGELFVFVREKREAHRKLTNVRPPKTHKHSSKSCTSRSALEQIHSGFKFFAIQTRMDPCGTVVGSSQVGPASHLEFFLLLLSCLELLKKLVVQPAHLFLLCALHLLRLLQIPDLRLRLWVVVRFILHNIEDHDQLSTPASSHVYSRFTCGLGVANRVDSQLTCSSFDIRKSWHVGVERLSLLRTATVCICDELIWQTSHGCKEVFAYVAVFPRDWVCSATTM